MLHDGLAQLEIPISIRPCRLLVRPHVRAVDKHHPELNSTLLNESQQSLPDARSCPAPEDLRRSPPGSELLRHSPPLGAILVPPEDGLGCVVA